MRNFDRGDRAMNAAIDSARHSVAVLLKHLATPDSGTTYLVAKMRFGDDERGEHIWFDSVRLDGGTLRGRLTEDAVVFPDVKAGQAVTVAPDSITDWMIIHRGALCGGFTLRVARARLTNVERAWLDSGLAMLGLPAWRVVNDC